MSVEILSKDLSNRRAPVAGLTIALAVLTVFALGIGSGLEDSISALTAGFPAALTAFIPAGVPGGYVVGEIFNLIAPITLVTYAIMAGATATAGEEQTGTMSMLSAQPVTRRAILGWKAVGLATALIGVLVVFGAAAAAAAAGFGVELTVSNIAATCLHLLLLAAFFGAVAMAVAAATGRQSAAAGAAGALAVASYLANAMLPLAGWGGWTRLSPWHYYAANVPLSNGINPAHLLVLAALAGIAMTVAVVSFDRRDLKG